MAAIQEELKRLREVATDLLARRQQGAKADDKAIKELSASGLLSLLRLRSANKGVALGTEELREETSKAKLSLEQADLALQNLLYESHYYEKEIQSCRSFQSAYSDAQIALQPVEEFWATADADLVDRAREQGSEHQLMLQRLSHEMRLRRKMFKDLEELRGAKSALLQQVLEQERTLKQLQGNLKSLDESARPLQGVLAGYPALRSITRSATELLPVALYVIYSQLSASREALGLPINVSIVGPQEEAVALAEQMAAEAEAGDDQKRTSKKRRLNSDDTYKVHPLAIELELLKETTGTQQQTLTTIKFTYLLNLNLVAAGCTDANDSPLLGALFPLDDGSTLPSEAQAQLENGTFQLDPSRPAKPYKWCQHLAGIDLIPSLPLLPSQLQGSDQAHLLEGLATYRTQQRVVTVVQRLQAVKEAHVALNALLTNMVKHPLPCDTSNYTRLPQTLVTSWELMKTAPTQQQQLAQHGRQRTQQQNAGHGTDTAAGTLEPPAEGDNGREEGEAPLPDSSMLRPGSQSAVNQQGALDEGEIPGSPAHAAAEGQEDEVMDYSQALVSPGPHAPAPNYFSLPDLDPEEDEPQQVVPKPPFRLYRCILRHQQLELEVHVRLYLEYPVRPPLLLVQSLRELGKDKRSKPRLLDAVSEKLVFEQEANIAAVQATPAASRHEMLLHQLLHLRLCMDDFAVQYIAETGSVSTKDMELVHLLQARQRRRGRDRRPPAACLSAQHAGSGRP